MTEAEKAYQYFVIAVPESEEQAKAYFWARKALQSTLTPPNEWVSVDERLPGVSGNYICAVKDKNGSVWTIPAEWSLEMKMWIGAFGEIKNIVTHWMPLPVAPALRPITREQVERVWRGKWIGTTDDDGCTWYECSRCEHDLDSLEDPNHFCPACGAPMTDKAVDMVMERLEALRDE